MNCPKLQGDRWNVSEADYRAYDALNFHTLANFKRDPRLWQEGYFDDLEETDAMRFGTAAHARILEGDEAYKAKIAVFYPPVNDKTGEIFGATTKAYKEAKAAFLEGNAGKTIISADDERIIDTLVDALRFHPIASSVFGKRHKETELAIKCSVEICGEPIELKGRIDCYSDAGIVDVKTTQQLTDASGRDRFRYTIYDYNYILQLAFYNLLIQEAYRVPELLPWWIVALEKTEPYRIGVYRIAENVQTSAIGVLWNWLESFVTAKKTATYESRFDTVQLIDNYTAGKDLM